MKKSFIAALLLLLFARPVTAQISQGNLLLGGSTSFASNKQGDFKSTEFSFAPNIGYFFVNNFAGGLRIQFDSYKEESDDAYNVINVAPFLRYYFIPIAKDQKVNVFADASYGFGSAGSGDNKMNMNRYAINAGPAIFLNSHTALEITLGYGSVKFEDIDDRLNAFNVNIGFQIHLNTAKKSK